MGQTLTHGVYLPDEGERNCYSGLAANWQLLDGAVGTVASHTTQIAGKAPAVHTHTKADITDFPAYGTTAGTICEGNDSRLSDARTPVAHTHGKADITDLFNSANKWTADNTFSNAIYALSLRVNNSAYASGTPSSNIFYNPLSMGGFVNNTWANSLAINSAIRTNGYNDFSIRVYSQTGNTLTGIVAETNADASIINFRPIANKTHNLGTSSYQWKTLNGTNPGALSLPDYNNYLDVTSSIPVASLDGSTSIQLNDYLADKTGWLSIVIDDTAGNFIVATQGRSGGSTSYNNSRTFHTGAQSNGYISVFFPILADMNKFVNIKASSLVQMRFYYCLGNV